MSMELAERLRARNIRVLPSGWQKGLKCPECHAGAERPKCLFEMGGACPRHDPENYDPSPFETRPDPLCAEAANLIEALNTRTNSHDALIAELPEHFPTGMRSRLGVIAATGETFESPIQCECWCGEAFVGSDEQEVRQLWAEHISATLAKVHPHVG
jgi:hypothetical protein